MGFFENLGRKVEEFKQTAADTANEEATHECGNCGERFFVDHDECPECGRDAVVARAEPASEGDAGSDGEVESGADDGGPVGSDPENGGSAGADGDGL